MRSHVATGLVRRRSHPARLRVTGRERKDRRMRKSVFGAAVAATVFSLGIAACGSDNKSSSSGGATTTAARGGPTTAAAAGGGATTTASGATTTAAGGGGAASGKVGVILPDSKSSVRWETADRKYLENAFKAAGVQYD